MSASWESIDLVGQRARSAATALARTSLAQRNAALLAGAEQLRQHADQILVTNGNEVAAAELRGLSRAILDRLALNPERLESMAQTLEKIAALPDPLHRCLASWQCASGLQIERVSTPLGVVGVIYESRPNVTADAAALCLKSGNAAILRSGSDSHQTSEAILACLQRGLAGVAIAPHTVQSLGSSSRDAVRQMLKLNAFIDVIVPRGGRALIEYIQQHSSIPTFCHLDGNCHTYIDAAADAQMATQVLFNAKMRRPGICGATETLLVHRQRLALLPELVDRLSAAGCQIRGDDLACQADRRIEPASEQDWDCEYLDAILAVRIVDDLDQALAHIARHGSQHTEAIITNDRQAAERFLGEVDAAIVIHNASTQFADGGEFGMGAEIGIATGRLHARGPVGAEQLTSFNYRVRGSGQCRP